MRHLKLYNESITKPKYEYLRLFNTVRDIFNIAVDDVKLSVELELNGSVNDEGYKPWIRHIIKVSNPPKKIDNHNYESESKEAKDYLLKVVEDIKNRLDNEDIHYHCMPHFNNHPVRYLQFWITVNVKKNL